MITSDNEQVWAVVLHWRLWRVTLRCVRSLLESDYPRLKVLVVDNGSGDGSAETLDQILGDSISILSLAENRYFAGGMNAGLEWARDRGCDYFLVLNNDTFVAPDTVSRLVALARTAPEVGIVAPVIYYAAEPDRIWHAGARRRAWLPFPHELARDKIDRSQLQRPLQVDYVTGCALMISRQALLDVGFFDTDYRMYFEDADYCRRARAKGYQIIVDPHARLWHLVGRSAREEPAINRYHRTRNRWRFYMSTVTGLQRPLVASLLLVYEGLASCWESGTGRHQMGRARRRALSHGIKSMEEPYDAP